MKRARSTRPMAQKKINMDPVVQEVKKDEDEDILTLTQIIEKKTPKLPKTRRRLVKTAARKGRNVDILEVMIEDQTLEVAEPFLLEERGVLIKPWRKSLRKMLSLRAVALKKKNLSRGES